MVTRIFDPMSERTIEGKFIGFQQFEFSEGQITYLPLLATNNGELVALPGHWLIMETLKANLDRLVEGETRIRVTYREGLKLSNGRMVFDYLIEINDQQAHYARIITKEQLREKLLGVPKQTPAQPQTQTATQSNKSENKDAANV